MTPTSTIATILFLPLIGLSTSEREHKVHNIVLYPEKHSWCKTTKIEQVVAMPGYEPTTIENNVCVGACYSYSIPRTQPAEPGELIGPYCDSCQPADSKCYHVTLKADGKNAGPRTAKKRVQIITNCTCQSCSKVRAHDCELPEEKTSELPTDLLSNKTTANSSRDDVPELLNVTATINSNSEPLSEDVNDVLRKKLIQSLRNVLADAVADPKRTEPLQKLELNLDDKHNRFSNDNLLALFTAINAENVDFEKINEILMVVRDERELRGRHRNYGLGARYEVPEVETNAIQKHFVGEIQNVGLQSGRLAKGPHGSLVVVPEVKVEQKFHLQSDNVKPNEEGLIIQYE